MYPHHFSKDKKLELIEQNLELRQTITTQSCNQCYPFGDDDLFYS